MASIGIKPLTLACLSQILIPNLRGEAPKAASPKAHARKGASPVQAVIYSVELNTFAKAYEEGVRRGDPYDMVRAWQEAQKVAYPAVKRGGMDLLQTAKPLLETEMGKGVPLAFTYYAIVIENDLSLPVHGNARFLKSIPYLKQAADKGEWRALLKLGRHLYREKKTPPAIGEAITGSKDPAVWSQAERGLITKGVDLKMEQALKDDSEAIKEVIGYRLIERGEYKSEPEFEETYWRVVERAKALNMPCVYEAEGKYWLAKYDKTCPKTEDGNGKPGDQALLEKVIQNFLKASELGSWKAPLSLAFDIYSFPHRRKDDSKSREWALKALEAIGGKNAQILTLLGEDEGG